MFVPIHKDLIEFKIRSLHLLVFVLLLVFIYVFSSCSNDTSSGINSIKIPKTNNSNLHLNDLAKNVSKVPLETKVGAFLTSILEVKRFNGNLLIRDTSGSVRIFDSKGNFVGKLGVRGEGPGEYRSAYSIETDQELGLIYLGSIRKLLVYDERYEFVKEKKYSDFITYISIVDHKPILIFGRDWIPVEKGFSNQTLLFELSPDLDITDSILLRNTILKEAAGIRYTSKHYLSNSRDGSFLYTPVLTQENILRDTLYKFEKDSIIPHLKFEFEEPHFDENGKKAVDIYNIMHSSSYIICEYARNKDKKLFIYSKKESKGYNFDFGVLDEDDQPVVLRPLDLENDIFYYVKEEKFQNTTMEEMNPVIGIVTLK
ncbi:6-bladed beta-propeller [Algoriphagus pacificus]|uniref:6-bladed beta-propeller n=1 Tax=Algoriphagus pacificus TaxID=2811234 RepID=A0ABS3CC78_9BACT|nr:6-bladed beta-propeller [Algoriphagus pacificus]MBN7814700.1 6-bladed beta-propeller [Algoriphagus pacificus]